MAVSNKMGKDIFPLKDPVKKSLFIPKILLESTNLWPEKRSVFTKITTWIFLSICIFIESGQVVFVISNIKDITKIASAMSTVSTTFQAITKLSILYIYHKELKSVLATIWHDFWPVKIVAGSKIEKELTLYNNIIIYATAVMFLSGVSFAFGFLSAPLRTGQKILPFEAIYFFDWSKSPLYEIIYVTEWITNIAFIVVGICGHDYLFVGICSNIVGQYTLLRAVLRTLGSEKARGINEKFTDYPLIFKNQKNESGKVLERCIKHHAVLTKIGEEVARIFSFSCFIQLFSSVTALCVAALIMTFAQVDVTLFTAVGAYLFGHLLQLFLFCTLGNEVTDHARKVPSSIFCSEWYQMDVKMKKDMLFVLHRSQREIKITALGILTLNFETFIAVLKLSFSFYTMLTKVTGDN